MAATAAHVSTMAVHMNGRQAPFVLTRKGSVPYLTCQEYSQGGDSELNCRPRPKQTSDVSLYVVRPLPCVSRRRGADTTNFSFFPVGREFAEAGNNGRQLLDDQVDLFLSIIDAKAESDGAVCHGEGNAHGA